MISAVDPPSFLLVLYCSDFPVFVALILRRRGVQTVHEIVVQERAACSARESGG